MSKAGHNCKTVHAWAAHGSCCCKGSALRTPERDPSWSPGPSPGWLHSPRCLQWGAGWLVSGAVAQAAPALRPLLYGAAACHVAGPSPVAVRPPCGPAAGCWCGLPGYPIMSRTACPRPTAPCPAPPCSTPSRSAPPWVHSSLTLAEILLGVEAHCGEGHRPLEHHQRGVVGEVAPKLEAGVDDGLRHREGSRGGGWGPGPGAVAACLPGTCSLALRAKLRTNSFKR